MAKYWVLVTCFLLLLGGCAPAPPPAQPAPPPAPEPAPEPAAPNAADYFPQAPGMKMEYAGLGNEFASWVITVLFRENGKLEWRRDTGGTTMAEVYRVEPEQVTLVYREGEAYDQEKRLDRPANTDQVILKAPIQAGTTWVAGDVTHTIVSTTEQVEAVGQTLTDVVVVEAKHPTSTIRTYYHKQYGMVLSVFESEGAVVESRLQAVSGP